MYLGFAWSNVSALLLIALLPLSWALKFDIAAHTGHSNRYERCIRNYASRETLVVVTAIVDGTKGDGQVLNMQVCSEPSVCPFLC